jgi:NAD(P)H-hydrate epimerase
LDLPTGLNPDTGEVDPACPKMDVTVALGYPKAGLLGFPGAEHAGRLEVAGIGIPPGLAEESEINLELMTPEWAGEHLPIRPPNSHKGTFGHTLVVAGSRNYVGAAYLAAQASVRTGAGLTTLASPSSVYPMAAGKLTEVIHLPLPEDSEGRIHPESSQVVRSVLDRYDVMLAGCGMGWSQGTKDFLEKLLLGESPTELPMVIDADGLNILSQISEWWRRLGGPVVLTPHPGEMATLTGTSTPEVQRDRINSARQWSRHWNVTVVLKGAHTLIAEPEGLVRISPFANPGLASGGTGDVLTGIIAGLMAQGLSPGVAAGCGVYIHGQAGEAVRKRIGDTGSIASDLIERLPETIRDLKRP